MSLVSSLQENPSSNPAKRKNLLLQLVYYLNIGFTSYGVGNAKRYSRDSTTQNILNYGPPIVYAKDCKGIMTGTGGPTTYTVNNPVMPIFSDSSTPPPLIWDLTQNQQLCLRINPTYWDNNKSDSIGFNVISLRDYMGIAPIISYNNSFNQANKQGPFSFIGRNSVDSTSGWCTKGTFSTGFPQIILPDGSYSDNYDEAGRQALFNDTLFPCYNPTTISFGNFLALCDRNKLIQLDPGIVMGKFIASLLPSRFLAIASSAASRNQKRPFASNNPIISSATLNLVFLTSDSSRCYQDSTISSANIAPSSSGYVKNGVDDSSILTMDPMQSMQNVDLTILDEWGISLQNYTEVTLNQSGFVPLYNKTFLQYLFLYSEGGACPPNFMTVAPWVAALNPNTDSSNTESTLVNENWYCNYTPLFYYNPTYATQPSVIPSYLQPQFPPSTTITHFGRILGYS